MSDEENQNKDWSFDSIPLQKRPKKEEPQMQIVKPDGAVVPSLASQITDNAIQALQVQREQLKRFVQSQLARNSDYGLIPNTKKDCLFKPGAEKIANLFQLGMRIVSESRDIDITKNWAMFSYRIELIHLPTGKSVSQCEGSANSQEAKYKSRPAADNMNTLMKMAQKRAYVGAVIIACGASDFFTQDVDDMDPKMFKKEVSQAPQQGQDNVPTCSSCKGLMVASKFKHGEFYCPNYKTSPACKKAKVIVEEDVPSVEDMGDIPF